MTNSTIIGDSSPLIALSIIGQLELLPKLYRRVVIPQKVWDEITVHGIGLPGATAIKQLDWLIIEKPAPEILTRKMGRVTTKPITPRRAKLPQK